MPSAYLWMASRVQLDAGTFWEHPFWDVTPCAHPYRLLDPRRSVGRRARRRHQILDLVLDVQRLARAYAAPDRGTDPEKQPTMVALGSSSALPHLWAPTNLSCRWVASPTNDHTEARGLCRPTPRVAQGTRPAPWPALALKGTQAHDSYRRHFAKFEINRNIKTNRTVAVEFEETIIVAGTTNNMRGSQAAATSFGSLLHLSCCFPAYRKRYIIVQGIITRGYARRRALKSVFSYPLPGALADTWLNGQGTDAPHRLSMNAGDGCQRLPTVVIRLRQRH